MRKKLPNIEGMIAALADGELDANLEKKVRQEMIIFPELKQLYEEMVSSRNVLFQNFGNLGSDEKYGELVEYVRSFDTSVVEENNNDDPITQSVPPEIQTHPIHSFQSGEAPEASLSYSSARTTTFSSNTDYSTRPASDRHDSAAKSRDNFLRKALIPRANSELFRLAATLVVGAVVGGVIWQTFVSSDDQPSEVTIAAKEDADAERTAAKSLLKVRKTDDVNSELESSNEVFLVGEEIHRLRKELVLARKQLEERRSFLANAKTAGPLNQRSGSVNIQDNTPDIRQIIAAKLKPIAQLGVVEKQLSKKLAVQHQSYTAAIEKLINDTANEAETIEDLRNLSNQGHPLASIALALIVDFDQAEQFYILGIKQLIEIMSDN